MTTSQKPTTVIGPATVSAFAAMIVEDPAFAHLNSARAQAVALKTIQRYLATHAADGANIGVSWFGAAAYKELAVANAHALIAAQPELAARVPNRNSIYAAKLDEVTRVGGKLSPTEKLTLLRQCEQLSDEEALTWVGKLTPGAAPVEDKALPTQAATVEEAQAIVGNACGVKVRGAMANIDSHKERQSRGAKALDNYATQGDRMSPSDRLTAYRSFRGAPRRSCRPLGHLAAHGKVRACQRSTLASILARRADHRVDVSLHYPA